MGAIMAGVWFDRTKNKNNKETYVLSTFLSRVWRKNKNRESVNNGQIMITKANISTKF